MAVTVNKIAFEDAQAPNTTRNERLRRIAFEDDPKANTTRSERFKGLAFEDFPAINLNRPERLKLIGFEDHPAINTARPERLRSIALEDSRTANAGRPDKIRRVAFEDYVLWPLNIKVQDIDGNLVSDAEVRIYSTSSSYGYNTRSDAAGLANILFKADDKHVLLISKAGFKTYKHHFSKEEPLGGVAANWEETLWPIVPVVTLQSGKIAKSLKPHDPINPMYD